MDPLIEDFIKETFHPDMADTITHSFKLMTDFGLEDHQSEMINLLMSDDLLEPQTLQDQFLQMVLNKLRELEVAHTLVLSPEISLWDRNEILSGLFAIQHLNDYSLIVTALETTLDPEEKLAEALAHCCALSADRIVSLVEHIDPLTLSRLQEFIHQREVNSGKVITCFTELQKRIIENLRLFKAYCAHEKIEHAMGVRMVETGMLMGQPLEHYMPFVSEALEHDNVRQLAIDIFSLLMITDDGSNNPLVAYKKHSGQFFDDLNLISQVDSVMISISGAFESFKNHSTVVKEST
jgi:hypothetical protein